MEQGRARAQGPLGGRAARHRPPARPQAAPAVRRRAAAGRAGPGAGPRAAACSCSTSRCPTSTPSCAPAPATSSSGSSSGSGRPRSTSPTTRSRRWASATGSRCMSHGRVRQIGPPVEVYDDPADTFVATFIGSPPMNLVPRDGPAGRLPARAPAARRDASAATEQVAMPLAVDRIEYLSGDRHVYGTVHRHRRGDPGHRPAARHRHHADRGGRDPRVRGRARPAAVLRRRHRAAERADPAVGVRP